MTEQSRNTPEQHDKSHRVRHVKTLDGSRVIIIGNAQTTSGGESYYNVLHIDPDGKESKTRWHERDVDALLAAQAERRAAKTTVVDRVGGAALEGAGLKEPFDDPFSNAVPRDQLLKEFGRDTWGPAPDKST